MNAVVINISAAVLVVICAVVVFRRVARDYERLGRLTTCSTSLEVLIFVMQGMTAGLYLGTDLTSGWLLVLAIGCTAAGLIMLFAAMGGLGMRKSVGQEVSGLKETGWYRYTRNPQLVAYGLIVLGITLCLPSWWALVWLGLYGVIAALMVRTEEAHLRRVYGAEYERYCQRAPRYLMFR
jgi:protein-S-isoprenylcysteine O-methyltransferase Ste14